MRAPRDERRGLLDWGSRYKKQFIEAFVLEDTSEMFLYGPVQSGEPRRWRDIWEEGALSHSKGVPAQSFSASFSKLSNGNEKRMTVFNHRTVVPTTESNLHLPVKTKNVK